MSSNEAYRLALSKHLGVSEKTISTYWKGRVALYTALKAMGVGSGDEVILPAFTCVVVPNAILYLGATPVYVDIDKETLCAKASAVEAKISARTKCILIQNMLGLSSEVNQIVGLAKNKGIYSIEDCTHGFGGTYEGISNGLHTDCSFYSSQWNKPFSTGIGGILYVKNETLLPAIENLKKELKTPSIKNVLVLRTLLFARMYVLKNWSYWFLLRLYRKLSALGLVVGSASKQEIESIDEPHDYFMGLSDVQAKNGVKALNKLDTVLQIRKKNGHLVNDWMKDHHKYHLTAGILRNHSFLKFPALVKDRALFLKAAENHKIPMGDWFTSPLHPVQGDLSEWKLSVAEFPNALEISAQIVNLPTDLDDMGPLLNFLEQHKNELL